MTNRLVLYILSASLVLAGCSDDAPTNPDAPDAVDAAVDAIDAPDRCPGELYFTGEYSDWDSTSANFDGVEFATWTVRGQPTRTAMTAPNGRIELCISSAEVSLLDVTQGEYLSALYVADPAVFQSPGQPFFLIKGLKTVRAPAFYQQSLGITFDSNRAHVLVQKQGTAIPLTLTVGGNAVTTVFAADNGDDTTWTAGNTGGLVLFANVQLPGLGTLGSSAAFVGPMELELEAGKLTLVTIR